MRLAIPAEQKCWQAPISGDKELTKVLKKGLLQKLENLQRPLLLILV